MTSAAMNQASPAATPVLVACSTTGPSPLSGASSRVSTGGLVQCRRTG